MRLREITEQVRCIIGKKRIIVPFSPKYENRNNREKGLKVKQENRDLIYLASCAVNGTVPDKNRVREIDMIALEKAAAFHKMDALAAYALLDAGEERTFCTEAVDGEVRKAILLEMEREAVFRALNDAHIWYMPLKGAVLKDYYPRIGMRQMSDADILFDPQRAEDVKNIMESLGFETVHFGGGHQDDYQKPPLSHFEMHRMLFAEMNSDLFYRYYENVEKRLIPGEGYERHFSHEDFYLYMIAHSFKHFYWNGTGLRSLLDVFVFLRKNRDSLDWNYLNNELVKLQIEEFERKIRELSVKVFSDGSLQTLSPEEEAFLDVFAEAGMYGTRERHIQIQMEKIGKKQYLLERVFLPMPKVQQFYPFFYQHKVLLPILPIYRLVRGRKNAKKELKILPKKH